jgi:biotin carboxyl carrier protein
VSDYEVTVDGRLAPPAPDWRLVIDDPGHGIGRLVNGEQTLPVVVEGSGTDWAVTVRGRRIPVQVRTWRERLLAEAESSSTVQSGPIVVKATLPGLIVAVAIEAGHEVEEGAVLLTIEAMKMQNEVRSPRTGRVVELAVAPGQAVATGTPLVRIE